MTGMVGASVTDKSDDFRDLQPGRGIGETPILRQILLTDCRGATVQIRVLVRVVALLSAGN